MAIATLPYLETIEYPESDGKPVAESEIHMLQLMALVYVLRAYYQQAQDVYVGGNMMMYYVEGDPKQSVAPDVFVVKGVPKRVHRSFKIWEEGKGPDVVIELSSQSTRYEDMGNKRGLYEVLGVQEYYIFDPQREYLDPPLRQYRLVNGVYEMTVGEVLKSEVLGLELHVKGIELHLYNPSTGLYLLTPPETTERLEEVEEQLEQTEERLEETAERLTSSEQENKRLRAELEKVRGDQSK